MFSELPSTLPDEPEDGSASRGNLVPDLVLTSAQRTAQSRHRVRGTVRDRAALDPNAQPYQDLIDQLFYGMAGVTADEVRGLEERYVRML